jgi:hypothetical protein
MRFKKQQNDKLFKILPILIQGLVWTMMEFWFWELQIYPGFWILPLGEGKLI